MLYRENNYVAVNIMRSHHNRSLIRVLCKVLIPQELTEVIGDYDTDHQEEFTLLPTKLIEEEDPIPINNKLLRNVKLKSKLCSIM